MSGQMRINYGGTVPISTVDWHGRVSITIFLRGCPLRCPYCQNYEFFSETNMVDVSQVEAEIKKSKPFVSSIVISGGEPLMQMGAIEHLATFAKKNGLLVGVHTNGFYPDRVAELIDKGLVDKFFIDVKAPPTDVELYGRVVGFGEYKEVSTDPGQIVERLARTVRVVESKMDFEIRTTVIRDLIGSADDISSIARWVCQHAGSDAEYVIQQGLPENAMQESLRKVLPFKRSEMFELANHARKYLENVWVRTKEGGNEKV